MSLPNQPENTYVPPGGPPQKTGLSPDIYGLMGEEAVFRMCRDFYRELESSPVRPMFPEDMPMASKRLACFLVGLFGGPLLYPQRYGPPRMRQRHLPFAIDESARRTWVDAFLKTLEHADVKYGFPAQHLPAFKDFLETFSAWMVNRAPEQGAV